LLVNVQRLMVIVIVEAVVENVDTVQVAASATSATDLVILLASVERRKIVVTSVMEPDTLPGTVARRRTPATTVIWLDTL